MAKKKISYAQSGVSIDANDVMVEKISSSLAHTFSPRVIELKNGFAGLFEMYTDRRRFKKNYRKPVLVACTDGVGTKVLIAAKAKRYESVGQDLVAMSVNDMLVLGAEPLFFLDYLAVNKLDPAVVAQMVEGVAKGCRIALLQDYYLGEAPVAPSQIILYFSRIPTEEMTTAIHLLKEAWF